MNLWPEVAPRELEAFQFMPKVTLSSLARECGVALASASRALSGHPNVSPALRGRVLALAEARGYRRNHLLSTIMGEVRSRRAQQFFGNLAIVHIPSPRQPELRPMQNLIIKAAQTRAHELGFKLGLFSLGGREAGPVALARVLHARGIMGVIFLQPHSNDATAGFPWDQFTSLQIDYGAQKIANHTVSLDHHLTVVDALAALRARGYRKFGLFIEDHKDDRIVHKWSAAFRSFQENQGGIGRIPVLKAETIAKANFSAWLRAHQPDLIVGHADRALPWAQQAGRTVPDDLGFFNLNWNERTRPCAGLDLRPELHGITAVETLAAQIQRNERGLPADPRTVMVSGRWVDGPTLRGA
jgi:LacI family transcriptional regulator